MGNGDTVNIDPCKDDDIGVGIISGPNPNQRDKRRVLIVSASDKPVEITVKLDVAEIATVNIEYQVEQFYDFTMLFIASIIKRIIVKHSVSAGIF